MLKTNRWITALRSGALHLAASAVVLAITGWGVMNFWYPPPYWQLAGLSQFIFWVALVDLICGPLLTLLVYDSQKSVRELWFDMGVVVGIQLLALAYGIHSLAQVRPMATVFEVDRFRVISAADIYQEEMSQLPHWFNPWSFAAPRLLGIKTSKSGAELLQSMDFSMAGIEPSQRPGRWQDYSLSVPQALENSKPLGDYSFSDPSQVDAFSADLARRGAVAAELRWLPVNGRSVLSWNLLLHEKTGMPFAFFNDEGSLVMWRGELEMSGVKS